VGLVEQFLEVVLRDHHKIAHIIKAVASKVELHVLKDRIRVQAAITTVQIQAALEIRVVAQETTKIVDREIIPETRVEEIVPATIRTVVEETQVVNPIIRTVRFQDRFVLR
jgi:hypothetical protein